MSPKTIEKQLSCNKIQKCAIHNMSLVIKEKSIPEVIEG
jgi:hypothetical protein